MEVSTEVSTNGVQGTSNHVCVCVPSIRTSFNSLLGERPVTWCLSAPREYLKHLCVRGGGGIDITSFGSSPGRGEEAERCHKDLVVSQSEGIQPVEENEFLRLLRWGFCSHADDKVRRWEREEGTRLVDNTTRHASSQRQAPLIALRAYKADKKKKR